MSGTLTPLGTESEPLQSVLGRKGGEQVSSGLILVLLGIGGLWLVILLPQVLSERKNTPLASTEEFNRQAARIADIQGYRAPARHDRRRVLARRRNVMIGLIFLAVAALAVAVLQRSLSWLIVHAVIDALLAWYLAVLLQIKQMQSRTMPPVRPIGSRPAEQRRVRVIAG